MTPTLPTNARSAPRLRISLVATLIGLGLNLGCQPPAPEESPPAESLESPVHALVTGTATVQLAITGMHCDGCAKAIRNGLLNREGVTEVEVSYSNALGVVTYDTHQISPDQMIAFIRDLTYDAEIVSPESNSAPAEPESPKL